MSYPVHAPFAIRKEGFLIESQVTCPNCGAEFSNGKPRCPYCGTLNPHGAELAYMQELEGLKDDTDMLDDNVQHALQSDFKRNAKRIVIVVVIVAAVIAISVIAANVMSGVDDQRELREFQARETFREQYFPELDRLYDSGDDDALSAFVWSLADDPGFEALFSWKHVGYLEVHDDWEALNSFVAESRNGKLPIDDYTWAVSVAARLAYPDFSDRYWSGGLSQDEEKRAEPYRAYGRQFLHDTLAMSEEEVSTFIDGVLDDRGDIDEAKLKAALKSRLEDLGTI